MSDISKKLSAKYADRNRYSNFGPCLRKIYIDGFRGIGGLEFRLDYPVTAISGLNGAGKTTLGQLAVCAYKKPVRSTNYKRQYIKDFFPVSPADPKPIDDGAKVIYCYESNDYRKAQEVTVARASSAWSGYKRQPERYCYYVGFTVYIPKVERRDLSVYGGAYLEFTEKRMIDDSVIKKMARVIGHHYDDILFQGVSHKNKESEIGIASRLGYSYSENNMGFGEGRVLYTIDKLENAPSQSLFVIEEPETSLHESAQHEFVKYLLDVCDRKGHQVVLSTHSSVILNALPPDARKFICRDDSGVSIQDKISVYHVKSILSSGHVRDVDICVEDVFAKVLLTEALRIKKPELVKTVRIHAIGDKDAVREAVRLLLKTGRKALAVRDADVGPDANNHLYVFPGTKPPEVEVFSTPSVKSMVLDKFGVDVDWVLQRNDIIDHHKIAECIACESDSEESVVRAMAINAYIEAITTEFDVLVGQILSECR